MNDHGYFRAAGIVGLISAICILVGSATLAATLGGGPDTFGDPAQMFSGGPEMARGLRRALTFGMFGFYLLLPPLVLALRELVRERGGPWADLFAVGGLAYALVGAIGAAIALTALPQLIESYQAASEAQRAALEAVFASIQTAVFQGLWNVLEKIPGGVFSLGIGWLIWPSRRYLGGVSIFLGAATLLSGLAWNLGLASLAAPLDMVYLVLSAVWAAWVGGVLVRHGQHSFDQEEPQGTTGPFKAAASSASRGGV